MKNEMRNIKPKFFKSVERKKKREKTKKKKLKPQKN